MSVDTHPSSFGFSEIFDSPLLNDLYGDDLAMAVEVFDGSGSRIAETIAESKAHLASGERQQLCRVIHRFKPVFGYTGLKHMQKEVEVFESRCLSGIEMADLSEDFRVLEMSMREAMDLISRECVRMKEHVNRYA